MASLLFILHAALNTEITVQWSTAKERRQKKEPSPNQSNKKITKMALTRDTCLLCHRLEVE
jgi:hypothetical protein